LHGDHAHCLVVEWQADLIGEAFDKADGMGFDESDGHYISADVKWDIGRFAIELCSDLQRIY
jgi:hypothetical protein